MRGTDPESDPTELVENSVLDALFNVHTKPMIENHVLHKRPFSIHTTEAGDESCAKKRARKELKWARKSSLVDEEIRQRRDLVMDAWASNSVLTIGDRSTTNGAEDVVGTTEGDLYVDLVGFEKSNPPTC